MIDNLDLKAKLKKTAQKNARSGSHAAAFFIRYTSKFMGIWSGKLKGFVMTKKLLTFLINSFSFLKKNFFNFGLEITVLALGFSALVFNLAIGCGHFSNGQNRFLAILEEHPQLNTQIHSRIKTEQIKFSPENEKFISTAAAATPEVYSGTVAQTAKDSSGKQDLVAELLAAPDSVITKPNFTTKDSGQRRDIREYTVKNGDSISEIAGNFGISIQTVLYENKLTEDSYIKPGQVLSILPTTGVKYTVLPNETLEQIAKKFGVDLEVILDYNEIEVPDDIMAGEVLIIPDGKVQIPESRKTQIATLNKIDIKQVTVPGNFIGSLGALIWPLPIRNITQYFWSRHKAIDVSNGQRPQFWAAQDGIVEISGWQAGYGNTIVINHGSGVKTRYGHASELYVSAGDRVVKGQLIGRVGNTGRVYGATGNHLHFEVVKNGTKINPLSALK
jgi:murein DD-endopeptidase MepM/ murein hydrolase activator NlpD